MRKICLVYLDGDLPLIKEVNDLALYLLFFSISYFVQKKKNLSRMKDFSTGSKSLVFAHISVKKITFYTEIFTQKLYLKKKKEFAKKPNCQNKFQCRK